MALRVASKSSAIVSRAMRRMMGSMNQVKVCMEVPCFVSGVNGGTLYASISSNALMNRSPCGVLFKRQLDTTW